MPTDQTKLIEIVLNGEARQVPDGNTVQGLLEFLSIPTERVAVELNLEIVRKPAWSSTLVEAGAKVEIVHFVGGGRA